MRHTILTRFAPAVLSLGLSCSLLMGQDLQKGALALLQQADSAANVEAVFQIGLRIADLSDDANTDPLHDAILAAVKPLKEKARLAAARALQDIKDTDVYGKDILELLTPAAQSEDPSLRAAALALLGEERFFNVRVLPDAQKLVEKSAVDDLVDPTARIEACVALWRIGTDRQRALAKDTLSTFLASTDRNLEIRGALALAEINTPAGEAWAVLREIRSDPTEQGRQARLYLQREEERRQFEELLSRLVQKQGATPSTGNEHFAVLEEVMHRVHLQHIKGRDVSDSDLLEFAAKGLLMGLDPHSTYFTSDEFQKFFFDLNREYGGIGAFVNFDQDNDFSIIRPIYSGPAYNAGLLSGDKILDVDGWDTVGHTSEEIISRMKGKPGTRVSLKIFRQGWSEPQDIVIERQEIRVPSVNHTILPGNVAYIELVNFSSNTSGELDAALSEVLSKKPKGIVLDVRNNTGGYLTQAREVVEKFVPGVRLVVYTEGPAEPRRTYQTRDVAVTDLPLAVLVNGFSASASEILSGALQDLGRAAIIGERTYGKGSVQTMMPLASLPGEPFQDQNQDGAWEDGEPYEDRNGNHKFDIGPHIKLTVAKYYLPSGRCLHKEFDKDGRIVDPNWGVIPDTKIDLLDRKPEDAWKNAAVFDLLRKNVFRDYVKKNLPDHKDLFLELAEGDGGDPTRYPGFEEFYESLHTHLDRDDVRKWIRYEVRDQVSDLRRKVYPGSRALGDPQEDAQLQEAVRQILRKSGVDIRTITAYAKVLKIPFGEEPRTGKK
ncbi:MAG: hypothetical protein Fur0037_16650 [Planctomycetota bacterium]